MILLIDDDRDFRPHIGRADMIARTPQAGLDAVRALLDSGESAQVWLDHDLGKIDGHIVNVMPIVDLLIARCDDAANLSLVVHTQNNAGARTMLNALRRVHLHVTRVAASDYLHVTEER